MPKMYINIDANTVVDPFLNRIAKNDNISEEMLYPFVDQYCQTHVTDLIFNNFCQSSFCSKSEVFEDFEAKFNKEYENGIKVDYKSIGSLAAMTKIYKDYGIDFFKVWLNRSREKGFNTWMSVRMNDCHYPSEEVAWLRDEFFYEAREKGWMLGKEYGYFRNCFDYKIEEIRQKMLDYITEQLFTYNVDGVELDFMREITCFKYMHDDMKICTQIMNDFMRDVKKITQNAAKKWNHEIKNMVRLTRNISDCLKMGFDASQWIKDGTVDIIVPSPRWRSSDSGIDIQSWKEFAKGAQVTACIETLVDVRDGVVCSVSSEVARGLASSYFAMGSEGIYFFNYFSDPNCDIKKDNIFHPTQRNNVVYRTCGEKDNIFDNPLRYVIIPQRDDFPAMSEIWTPLPAKLGDGEAKFEIITGKIPANKKVSCIIGTDNEEIEVIVNDTKCTKCQKTDLSNINGMGTQPSEYMTKGAEYIMYEIDSNILNEYKQIIKLKSNDVTTISWIEFDVV